MATSRRGAGVEGHWNRRHIRTLAAFCAALGVILYASTIGFDFAFDDYSTLRDNRFVHEGVRGIPKLLSSSVLSGYRTAGDELYRPLSLVMFALEWEAFPDNPAVGHAVNVALYGLTGFLICVLLDRLLRSGPVVPVVATGLFMAHPVHTEVVANIKGRDEILGLLLGLATLALLVDFLDRRRGASRILAGFTFLLALLAKESAITLMVVIPLAAYVFRGATGRRLAEIVLPIAAAAGVYFLMRASALEAVMNARTYSLLNNVIASAPGYSDRLATAIYVLGKYLLLLVYPARLSMDYSFREIELATFSSPFVLLSLLVYGAMVIFAVRSIKKPGAAAFGVWYYLITISLVSNLVILIGTVMAERLLYTPSLGICLVAAVVLARAFPPARDVPAGAPLQTLFTVNRKAFAAAAVLLVLLGARTFDRTPVWRNNATLFRAAIDDAPESSRTHLLYGMELAVAAESAASDRDGLQARAMTELQRAIELYPSNVDAYREIGLIHHARQQYDEAIASYDAALALAPREVKTLNNKGVTRFAQGDQDEAMRLFQRCLEEDPQFTEALKNLGICYARRGEFDRAIACYQRALEYDPGDRQTWRYIGLAYRGKGDEASAQVYLKRSSGVRPDTNDADAAR